VDLAGDPYEALGYVGFRGVSPHESLLVQPTGGPYALSPGSFFSVDCSRVVSSHGDILHRELAWLTYAAAAASDGSPRPR